MTAVLSGIPVRVWVTDVWDTVHLTLAPETTVVTLKMTALRQATGRTVDPTQYCVKFRGGVVADEQLTLAALNAPPEAPFIVLPVHRRPVR